MKRLKITVVVIATILTSLVLKAQTPTPNLIINKELIINASIEKTWQILGPEFANAYKWASAINYSEGHGEGQNGAICSERGCDVSGIGEIQEKILRYSETEHVLKYKVTEGMPKMVKYSTNNWKLVKIDDNKTKLELELEMKTGGFIGWLMKPMMKMKMKKLAKNTIEEFKYYIEKGQPHPRKVKATTKNTTI